MQASIGKTSHFMLRRRNEDGMTDISADERCCDLGCREGHEKEACGAEGSSFGAANSLLHQASRNQVDSATRHGDPMNASKGLIGKPCQEGSP